MYPPSQFTSVHFPSSVMDFVFICTISKKQQHFQIGFVDSEHRDDILQKDVIGVFKVRSGEKVMKSVDKMFPFMYDLIDKDLRIYEGDEHGMRNHIYDIVSRIPNPVGFSPEKPTKGHKLLLSLINPKGYKFDSIGDFGPTIMILKNQGVKCIYCLRAKPQDKDAVSTLCEHDLFVGMYTGVEYKRNLGDYSNRYKVDLDSLHDDDYDPFLIEDDDIIFDIYCDHNINQPNYAPVRIEFAYIRDGKIDFFPHEEGIIREDIDMGFLEDEHYGGTKRITHVGSDFLEPKYERRYLPKGRDWNVEYLFSFQNTWEYNQDKWNKFTHENGGVYCGHENSLPYFDSLEKECKTFFEKLGKHKIFMKDGVTMDLNDHETRQRLSAMKNQWTIPNIHEKDLERLEKYCSLSDEFIYLYEPNDEQFCDRVFDRLIMSPILINGKYHYRKSKFKLLSKVIK